MKRLILLPLSLFFAGSTHAAYDSKIGTIEWFIEKNNSIYQKQVIGSPNNPKYNRTLGTMTKPIGSTKLPTYMPQRITQQSFARGMFNALVKRHPLVMTATTALTALEIYECVTAESGWCKGDGQPDPSCPAGGQYIPEIQACGIVKPATSCKLTSVSNWPRTDSPTLSRTVTPPLPQNSSNTNCPADTPQTNYQNCEQSITYDYSLPQVCDTTPFQVTMTRVYRLSSRYVPGWPQEPHPWQTTDDSYTNTQQATPTWQQSPDVDCADFDPFTSEATVGINTYCYYNPEPTDVDDVTLDDLKEWIAERPNIFDDISDDILKDPTTGKPDDTFFDKPKHTPIGRQISDAFDSIASGNAQDNNPSAPHYIPPELKPEVEEALDKFHDGEPFVDPFTNTTVTPDPTTEDPSPYTPPAEVIVNLDGLTVDVEVEMNWDEFPGITQDQYEESNDKLAESFDSVEMPDIEGADNDFFDTLQENPDLPFDGFQFGDLWPIAGGQCTGFMVTMAVRGDTKSVMMDKHCPPYNEWAHPLIAWFLQLLAALHIFHLFSRMMSAG